MDTATARPTVFVSYSHQDEAWKDRLVKQLQVLELEGDDLEVWNDRRIVAGDDWLPEIKAAIARARAAVLLISADFLTSKFIRGKEVPEILRRREGEGLRVIPVIVDHCAWKATPWLANIACRPTDGKPLTSFTRSKAEKHLADLALDILNLLASPGVQTPGSEEIRVALRQPLHRPLVRPRRLPRKPPPQPCRAGGSGAAEPARVGSPERGEDRRSREALASRAPRLADDPRQRRHARSG